MKLFLLLLTLASLTVGSTANYALTYSGRSYDGQRTTFSYSMAIYEGANDLSHWTLEVPNCLEIVPAQTIPATSLSRYVEDDGMAGIKWEQQSSGTTRTYTLIVEGNVGSGQVQFVTMSDSLEIHTQTTYGPACERIAELTCNAGGPYIGECIDHVTRIALSGSGSQHAIKYIWSTSQNGASFNSAYQSAPTLSVAGTVCEASFEIELEVEDINGSKQTCTAQVIVQDETPPLILGLWADDMTVDCDDIPVAPIGTAKDNCDANVNVNFEEHEIASPGGNVLFYLRRSWSVTDSCGNSNEHVQTITVRDANAPELVGVADDEIVDCSSVPAVCEVDGFDACDGPVDVLYTEARNDGSCAHSYTLTRSWTAVDSVGNAQHASQVVTVQDHEHPMLVGVPAESETVDCDNIPDIPVVSAMDNCGTPSIEMIEHRNDGSCHNEYTLTRTWTAVDDCGNHFSDNHVIHVEDSSAPVLSGVVSDKEADCAEIPVPCEVTAQDNCDGEVDVLMQDIIILGSCVHTYDIVYLWTATDSCGNVATETQTVMVSDSTPPQLNGPLVPDEIHAQCDAVPDFTVSATDDCTPGAIEVFYDETRVDGASENDYTLHRVWTAHDACGNSDSIISTVHVSDTQSPVLAGVPDDVTTDCGNIPDACEVTVSDQCACSDMDVYMTETRVDGSCDHSYSLVRTWRAQDCSGNDVTDSQRISVVDEEAPQLVGLPGNIDVDSEHVPNAPSVVVTDNCDTVLAIYSEVRVSGSCPQTYTLIRTWTATDDCGNSVSHSQTIGVTDDTDPIFLDGPDDRFVECGNVPPAHEGSVSVIDNSGVTPTVEFSEVRLDGTCPEEYQLRRTWTAIDECGNTATYTVRVTVSDSEAPNFDSLPTESLAVENGQVPDPDSLTATDACSPTVDIDYSEIKTPTDCVSEFFLTRTWSATDPCGNVANTEQAVTVEDTTAPVLHDVPADTTVSCDAIPDIGTVTATDLGENVFVAHHENHIEYSCADSFLLVRTWTASDCVGNSVSDSQTVTVIDGAPPTLTGVPDDLILGCDETLPMPVTVTAVDDCTTTVSLQLHEDNNNDDCDGIITRTWTASDVCSNSVSETQTITIFDSEGPTLIGIPADKSVSCEGIPAIPSVTAVDACDPSVHVEYSETVESGSCDDNYVLVRVWLASDRCGHTDEQRQTITVTDHTDPLLTNVPVSNTYPCHDVPTVTNPHVSDNCDSEVDLGYSETRFNGANDNQYTLTRSWTATDNCGNTDDATQLINVVDNEDPVLHGLPGDAQVACDNLPEPADVTATDNCDVLDASYDQDFEAGSCTGAYTIIRTWTATDVSGNVASHAQTITVDDFADPTWTSQDIHHPVAVDNCGSVDIDCTTVRDDSTCETQYTETTTCTATDECGNMASFSDITVVTDDIAPELYGVPDDINLDCHSEIPSPATVSSPGLEVSYISSTIPGGCEHDKTVIRTWSATDCAGNAVSESQTITVLDSTPPTVFGVPADTTVECDDPLTVPTTVTATDNCDTSLTPYLTVSTIDETSDHTFTLERKWIATDSCGLTDVDTQTVTVVDTTDPVLHNTPIPDVDSPCGSLPSVATVTASDNCDNVYPEFSEIVESGECPCDYVLHRTWVVADFSGNTEEFGQAITVSDNNKPTLSQYPAHIYDVQVHVIPEPPVITAYDVEDGVVEVTYHQRRTDGDSVNEFTLEREWTACDDCNNCEEWVQIITVIDTIPVILEGVPPNMAADCHNIPDPADVTVIIQNSADQGTVVVFSQVTDQGSCPHEFVLIRTWSATDPADNTVSGTQTVTVSDTELPTWHSTPPTDTTTECSVPNAVTMTAIDNCGWEGNSFTADMSESRTDGQSDNEYTLTRSYQATDECGNTITHSYNVNVQDTVSPTFVGAPYSLPMDETVECNDVPSPNTLTGTDACGGAVIVVRTEQTLSQTCSDGYTEIRTWTATDVAGNAHVHRQTIVVEDSEPPVFNYPPNTYVSAACDDVPDAPTLTAEDNCAYAVNVVLSSHTVDTNPSSPNSYTLYHVYTATDNCGNSDTFTQTVSVSDTGYPALVGIPANRNAGCNNVPEPPTVTASDNCDNNAVIEYSEVRTDASCSNSYTLVRTWSATDSSGLTTDDEQTITVHDNGSPTLYGTPSVSNQNIVVSCDAATPLVPTVTAHDTCDGTLDVDYSVTVTELNCNNYDHYTTRHERVWRAVDTCGNQVTAEQSITFQDASAPTLSSKPIDVHVSCEYVPAETTLTAEDNCDNSVDVLYTEDTVDGSCSGTYTLVRSWEATDSCGHSDTHTQSIEVSDTESPILSGLPAAYVTADCESVPEPPTVTADDNCAVYTVNVQYSQTPETPPTDTHSYTLTRTWTAVDDCGNTVTFEQTIDVADSSAPYFVYLHSDTTVECDDIPTIEAPTAEDNCDTDVDVEHEEYHSTFQCTHGYDITHKFTATDETGLVTQGTTLVHVVDTTPPVISGVPEDTSLECTATPELPVVTVTDNCDGSPSLHIVENHVDGDADDDFLYTLFRSWTATDACGNSAFDEQTVTVSDTESPILSGVPGDVTLNCEAVLPYAHVLANDECDASVELDYSLKTTEGSCQHTWTVERTWIAMDSSGNTVTGNAVAEFQDVDEPVLVNAPVHSETSVECDNIPSEPQVIAVDNCDTEVTVDFQSNTIIGAVSSSQTIYREWTAVDACGNVAHASQTLVATDTTPPTLGYMPSDSTVDCAYIPQPTPPQANDNCDTSVSLTYSEETVGGSCDHQYTLIRSWMTTDEAGNTVTDTQTIEVTDNEAPTLLNVPGDTTVECDNVPPNAGVMAVDNCADAHAEDLNLAYSEVRENGSSDHSYTLFRTWHASDACGNSASAHQTIVVQDTESPVITSSPGDVTVSVEDVTPGSCDDIVATDNCAPVECRYTQERQMGTCLYAYTLVRTFEVLDEDGNTVSTTQEVIVIDATPPELHGVPADTTVEYSSVPALEDALDGVYATDNSGAILTVTVSQTITPGATVNQYIIRRTYSVEDDCGNTASEIQIISVRDTTPPVLCEYPSNLEVECDALPEPCENCVEGEVLDLFYSSQIIDQDDYADSVYSILRTWSADDGAGNVEQHTQTITVVDSVKPVLSRQPADVEVDCDCDTFPAFAHVEAIDNCDDSVEVEFSEIRVTGASPDAYTLFRTWTATDATGNSQSHTQEVKVIDPTSPVLSQRPSNLFVQCDAVPAPSPVYVHDNCDDTVDTQLQFHEEVIETTCTSSYVMTRSWSATDRTGNHVEHTQTITVEDAIAPTYVGDEESKCLYPPNGKYVLYHNAKSLIPVTDNCDTSVDITFVSCNSTQPSSAYAGGNAPAFDNTCMYNSNTDTLSVMAQRNEGPQYSAGREYHLYARLTDDCGNKKTAKTVFWVPYDGDSMVAAGIQCSVPSYTTYV